MPESAGAHVGDDSVGFAAIERDFVRRVVGVEDFDWVPFGEPSPRNELSVPLEEARVALVTTAGAHETGTPPLGAGGQARLVPAGADVELSHIGYDTDRAQRDPDVVYPVGRASTADVVIRSAATRLAISATATTAAAPAGPWLIGGSAFGESLLAAGAGAVWGLRVLTRARPGAVVAILAGSARSE